MLEIKENDKFQDLLNYLSSCVNCEKNTFKNKELIVSYPAKRKIAFITEGFANIVKTDINGRETIIRELKKNDVFSEEFFKNTQDDVYIISASDTTVFFIDYYNTFRNCTKNCLYHNKLCLSLFQLLINECMKYNERLELLAQKTVRDKILYFLQKRVNEKGIFRVTTSYKAISEYLFVDRSNLMRELKKLEDDKIIKKDKNTIYIKKY